MNLRRFTLASLALAALPALAAYDIRGVQLGAAESEVKKAFPSAHCKALEWQSKAADRRCDDSRTVFGGVEVRVTLYLRKDAVEAFDVRFETKELDRFVAFIKQRYGEPKSEARDSHEAKGKPARQVYRAEWQKDGEHAVLTAQLDKRAGSMLVSRGNFEEEIYRVR